MSFHERLGARMLRLRWSNRELADVLGVNQKSVWQWVNGHSRPTPERLAELAEVLGVSRAWLMGEEPGEEHLELARQVLDLPEEAQQAIRTLLRQLLR